MRALALAVCARYLYSVGISTLTSAALRAMKAWENCRGRRLAKLNRAEGETIVRYMIRTAHRLQSWFDKAHLYRLHERAIQAHHARTGTLTHVGWPFL